MSYSILKPTIQDAFDRGEVLYFIDQTDFKSDIKHPDEATFPDLTREDGKDKRDDLQEGICAGLAMHWLALRYDNRDFPTQLVDLDEDPVPAKGRGKRPMPRQVRFVDARHRKAAENQLMVQRIARQPGLFLSYVDAVMTAQYGIEVNRRAFRRHAGVATGAYLADEIKRSGDGLYYVGMRRPDGGHAIAIQHHHHNFCLFDGNSAGYSFNSSKRLFSFFQAYIDDFGYSGRCTEATWTGKIEPQVRRLPSHHEYLEHFARRTRGTIQLQSSVSNGHPTLARPGRTPAYTGAW